ncbi:MAG: 2-oxoglutarate dehydrogenase E1 component, partial [Longimicrobiaceae bacterium]
TSPQFGRSSPYPSDVAKAVQAPILHVNGDDPEAVTFACKLAIEYRQTFNRDIVIDMWCYRRFGHNEGDEPSFTQPLMYAAIRNHPPVSTLYADRLVAEGVIEPGWLDRQIAEFTALLETEFEAAKTYLPNKADWFEGAWAGLNRPQEAITERRNVATGVSESVAREIGTVLTTIPEGFTPHKTLARIVEARRQMFETGEGFDWATAEALAFGSLLREGHPVRLSGQDSGRGTFSQRHGVWVDQSDGRKHIPLTEVGPARFEVRDSPLSEFGVMGFEYGYSLADPQTLVLWEAQFGDFVNGAQVMIDQFLASSYQKWEQTSGLVLLLPHGYEGQGPEHSSARLERFLQLSAENNFRVVNLTTSAQYFHVLRRQAQMLTRDPRPLIVMSPKSLLRHPLAASRLEQLATGGFRCVLGDEDAAGRADEVTRLVLCSGKVFADLYGSPLRAEARGVALGRVEELYPFPGEEIAALAGSFPRLREVVWAQEEPRNMGAWTYMEPRLRALFGDLPVRYEGRPERASPAEGSADRHAKEQARIVAAAWSDAPAAENPAERRARGDTLIGKRKL